ncbi:MAG: transposase [Pseudomonadota bacterium]
MAECVEALSSLGFEPRDAANTDTAAGWLQRLSNNRTFLADLLIDRLAGRTENEISSGYGPQAIVLSPVAGNMFLRANIWPSERDLCFRSSGAKTFVYGVPHDHNFAFLTSGYLGPGYRSDYFEYDYEAVSGYAGERVPLRFVERSALHQGKVMLYRAHRDVHSQLPPESLSVSLNVMHADPSRCWFDQYGFDLENREIERVLSPNATEVFLRVAVASGTDEALDFADWTGRTHPSERLRLASFEARAARASDPADTDRIWQDGERCGSLMVAAIARKRRATVVGD